MVTHKTIAKVSADLHDMGFNTAIASLMELVNDLYKAKAKNGFSDIDSWKLALDNLLQMMAPFAPHIAEELWSQLGNKESIHTSNWPVHDPKYLVSDTMNIVVQVNGKLRANIAVAIDADEKTVINKATSDERVASYLTSKPKKTIYVPGKLVNFVV